MAAIRRRGIEKCVIKSCHLNVISGRRVEINRLADVYVKTNDIRRRKLEETRMTRDKLICQRDLAKIKTEEKRFIRMSYLRLKMPRT